MAATLFQSGNDLSEDFQFLDICKRVMKTDRFDTYALLLNPDIEVKLSARREKSEWNEKKNCYIAGESYDSFDVWVKTDEGSSRKAENLRSFEEAVRFAMQCNATMNVLAGTF